MLFGEGYFVPNSGVRGARHVVPLSATEFVSSGRGAPHNPTDSQRVRQETSHVKPNFEILCDGSSCSLVHSRGWEPSGSVTHPCQLCQPPRDFGRLRGQGALIRKEVAPDMTVRTGGEFQIQVCK